MRAGKLAKYFVWAILLVCGTGTWAQAQATNQREVAAAVHGLEIIEQTGALAHHHQQAAPAGMIFLVRAQVFGQFGDARGEQSHLNFGGTRIIGFAPVVINNRRLAFLRDCHRVSHHLRRL